MGSPSESKRTSSLPLLLEPYLHKGGTGTPGAATRWHIARPCLGSLENYDKRVIQIDTPIITTDVTLNNVDQNKGSRTRCAYLAGCAAFVPE